MQPYTVTDADALDGMLVVPPGSILSLEGVAAAGTSPLVTLGLTWAEVNQ